MKNKLILVVSIVFLISCGQGKSNNEANLLNNKEQLVDTDTTETVQLAVEPEVLKLSALPDSIKVTMSNNTRDTITTGLYYSIEKLKDDGWYEVSPKNIVFQDLGWQLKPNASEAFAKKLYKDVIHYETGKYRVVKYYLKSDYTQTKKRYDVYAEFNIGD